MQSLGVIDIGGTTIKFAVWQDQQLVAKTKVTTPTTLAEFYTLLTTQVAQMKRDYQIAGVGISSPGAVNKATGIIEGASALPYIHNFRIHYNAVLNYRSVWKMTPIVRRWLNWRMGLGNRLLACAS